MVVFLQFDLRSATHISTVQFIDPTRSSHFRTNPRSPVRCAGGRVSDKPPICTADELHYVHVPNSTWRLALWRYTPSPQGAKRNHPLLLLSGVGTNAIGYDLAPGSSFARYMSSQGFDTWILEVRGAGLSVEHGINGAKQSAFVIKPDTDAALSPESAANVNSHPSVKSEVSSANRQILEPMSLLQARLDSAIATLVRDGSRRLANIMEDSQQLIRLQERFFSPIDDFQKQLDLLAKYDWDFDHYLEDDVPAAMDYIRNQCKPKDNKLLAIGHSMGGILLYAMLSRNGYLGRDSDLAFVVTLGSSLDYTTSRSSLKLLLPIVDPARALSVSVVPLGALIGAAYPLASRPPYFLSWLNPQISAQNMMHPEIFEKLVLNNFCTIPAKLLLQLRTVFQEGGLCDRSKTFFYKDHLCKSKVPVLALAGDQDLICPPEAVYETVKLIPGHLATFKVFGEPSGPHYAHYDLVVGCLASDEVYPCIIRYLLYHDVI